MHLLSIFNISKTSLLSILLALMPFSFIAGNMLININLILLIVTSFIFYKGKVFKINFHFLDKLIICFFIFILFTGFYNYFFFDLEGIISYLASPLKSIFFVKYLVFYLVVRFLIEKDIINLKLFFIFCSISVLFVSLDIILQFITGKDIFGFTVQGRKLSGPFGDELIAGGFIQRFSLFLFFLIPLYFSNKIPKNLNKYLVVSLFIIIFSGIILSGNRMPALIFLLTVFLVILFNKQTRKFLIPFVIVFSIVFTIIFKSNEPIRVNFMGFFDQIKKTATYVAKKDFFNESAPQYLKEFSSFYDTWLMNKFIGGGIKNFRFYCHHRPNIDKSKDFICNMHPHNYYLEILTETGIIGFFIISSIFLIILYYSFYKKYISTSLFKNNITIIPFIFVFIAEIFPIKSTGSFFTTGNSTYLFLIIGILIGMIRKENLIESKYQ